VDLAETVGFAWWTSKSQAIMTRRVNNILFIMCDQLRWDYLG
jgi:hypothetical protein